MTKNFMNVFNGVTSPRVLSYRCVLPVGFNFNSIHGLKPQVNGIKIFNVYRRSIFQVKWFTATLIDVGVIRGWLISMFLLSCSGTYLRAAHTPVNLVSKKRTKKLI